MFRSNDRLVFNILLALHDMVIGAQNMNILRNVYAGIAEIFFKPFKNLGNKKLSRILPCRRILLS